MYYRTKQQKHLVVLDVDNTILGKEAALIEFKKSLTPVRSAITLVYNSGRNTKSIRNSILENPNIPEPDYLVGELGTIIENFQSRELDKVYFLLLNELWHRSRIEKILDTLQFEKQPEEFQSEVKLSYYALPSQNPKQMVKNLLFQKKLRASVIYSGSKYLDILPWGIGKGYAVKRLQKTLRYKDNEIIVAGDSGNDMDMFKPNYKGIVVANAHNELLKLASRKNVFIASQSYAAGVVQGLMTWGVIHE